MSLPAIKINVGKKDGGINVNLSGTNSHYITYDAWNELVEQTLNPRYVTKEDFDAFQNQLPTKYITENDVSTFTKILYISLSDYDALATKDLNTLYLIV